MHEENDTEKTHVGGLCGQVSVLLTKELGFKQIFLL